MLTPIQKKLLWECRLFDFVKLTPLLVHITEYQALRKPLELKFRYGNGGFVSDTTRPITI